MPATGKLTQILEKLEESGFLRQYAPTSDIRDHIRREA